jgi:flavin reductase (DIM6/NTAB) family NADH-FMN oxidoreductase RutF
MNGMIVVWVIRVLHNPVLVAVSVGKTRYTHDMIHKSGFFCINILSEAQVELARIFGFASGQTEDKFKGIKCGIGKNKAPILEDIAGHMECKLQSIYDAGDHSIFIGEVTDSSVSGLKPLKADEKDYI